jgi:tryptophan halogenase
MQNNVTLTDNIKSIGIIGGGSAGYFSALYLKKKFPEIDITLVESSSIPIIGVGEATTPLIMNFLHKTLGYSTQEFFQKTKPTLKLGVKFEFGKKENTSFNNPFGTLDLLSTMFQHKNINNCNISSMLMTANKAPFLKINNKITPLKLDTGYAYHIDNVLLVRFLKEKLISSGCNYKDATIKEGTIFNEKEGIKTLITTDDEILKYDLYVDCSGFSSLLLGKVLKSKWIDYSSSLKTNRAIVGSRNNENNLKPYTTASTLNHGWLWNTPTQEADHLGYVFAKEFCSDDEAFSELKKHCNTINNEKVISFKTGRYENPWLGNTIAIGNSFAFIEPLESTGIHMIILQLSNLQRAISKNKEISNAKLNFNSIVNSNWDNLKYFIATHFKYNHKLETPFWKECQNNIDVNEIQDYIDYFKENGPIYSDLTNPIYTKLSHDQTFRAFSYDVILTGMGLNETYYNDTTKISSQNIKVLNNQFKLNQHVVNQAISHKEALKYFENENYDFIENWFEKTL